MGYYHRDVSAHTTEEVQIMGMRLAVAVVVFVLLPLIISIVISVVASVCCCNSNTSSYISRPAFFEQQQGPIICPPPVPMRASPEREQRRTESEYTWRGTEDDLPLTEHDVLLYQCVILYLGCVDVAYEFVHTRVLDKAIQHLHDVDSLARTVIIQVYQRHTLIRNSSNKVCILLPNESIRICLCSPKTPLSAGLIVTRSDGSRECFVFGVDRQLLPHESHEHQRYVKTFGLKCYTSSSSIWRDSLCPAFPTSPARLMHYLNDAKTYLMHTRSRGMNDGCGEFLSSVKTQIANFCTPKKLKNSALARPAREFLLVENPNFCNCRRKVSSSTSAPETGSEIIEISTFTSTTKSTSSLQSSFFADSLRSTEILSSFHKFLEEQHCAENLNFYTAVEEFKKIEPANQQKLVSCAQRIYERHLAANSPETVNVDSYVVKEIREDLACGRVFANVFNEAQAQVRQILQYDCWPRFVKSSNI
ncbi:hypothetical protein QR680_011623 [Steinernema hermaphroditum]|uniref:RGS domain-containing protein n=1 Tax=Steinernema hermaphroditum TaxID=289476 RepID=A0AA39I1F0_9BILA|nr:hypothetical protein QR680_011623 [Steinernema hermaphroditum]